ncbi:MAG: hypothetical protein HMLKMBBP_00870 [Planctomycetes bacterium]|nr:hypothetical protein [Planctomycetota bacterium]
MPEKEPRQGTVAPDRERDAGLRGEELARATWALGLVFAGGLAVLAVVLMTRRRQPRP